MDGLLVIDKPAGPTSHDVVARARRLLRERRVGHTGTLDPIATGVLPLVVGRATRLARFLSAGGKSYEAVIRLGVATDTGDAAGTPMPDERSTFAMPAREAIEAALADFRGTFLQAPPAFSAKKIRGRRSYRLARAATSVPQAADLRPSPVSVSVHRLELVGVDADTVSLSLDCSAGFYVRTLAHELGERLGVGGHLAALRRIRNGDYCLDDAIPLDAAEGDPAAAVRRLIPMSRMLPRVPAATLTAEGVRRVRHGLDLGPAHLENGAWSVPDPVFRLLDSGGELVGIAAPAAAAGLLHPFVVLM